MYNFKILSDRYNDNGDRIFHFKVPPHEMIYMGYLLESLEGWAYYTTIDIKESILHVEVIKDYVAEFDKLLGVILGKTEIALVDKK